MDVAQAYFGRSQYNTPEGSPLESYHLSTPRTLLDYISGRKHFVSPSSMFFFFFSFLLLLLVRTNAQDNTLSDEKPFLFWLPPGLIHLAFLGLLSLSPDQRSRYPCYLTDLHGYAHNSLFLARARHRDRGQAC